MNEMSEHKPVINLRGFQDKLRAAGWESMKNAGGYQHTKTGKVFNPNQYEREKGVLWQWYANLEALPMP